MTHSTSTLRRRATIYTPESAQRALPLLASIARDAHSTYLRLRARLQSFDAQRPLGKITSDASLSDEVREELAEVNAQMRELAQLGVRFGDPELGVVLLDAVVNERDAVLCWKLGETRIRYWYGLGERYEDRRPLRRTGG